MIVEIDLNGRMTANLEALCEAQGVTPEEYCFDAVRQRMDIDRFGDLNKIIEPQEEKKVTEDVPKEVKPVENAEVSQKSDKFVTKSVEESKRTTEEEPKRPKTGRRTLKVKTKTDE